MNYEEKAKALMRLMPATRSRHTEKHIDLISRGENLMLECVAKNGGVIMPGEIAKAVGVSTARVTAFLNNAEHKGYIRRERVVGDRRKIHVIITDIGLEKIQNEHQKMLERMMFFLEKLGEEDTENLVRIMEKTQKILNSDEFKKEAEK